MLDLPPPGFRGLDPSKPVVIHRGHLPHWRQEGASYFVTFRLADSLPKARLSELREEREQWECRHPEASNEERAEAWRKRRAKIERWLDRGHGSCVLAQDESAGVVQRAMEYFADQRYGLFGQIVMPNHVHVLIRPHISLGLILQSWKSYTGRWALQHNEKLGLGIQGESFWMREYWDRFIRNLEHFENAASYIRMNPVNARLCAKPEDWRWGSAWSGR